MLPFHLLPKSWRSGLAQHSIEPIQSGSGGALVYRVQGTSGPARFLKIAAGKDIENLSREIKRTRWLRAQGINVPMILQATVNAEVAAMLMSSVDGQPVEDCRGSPTDIINAVAKGLANLHALPANSCPYRENVGVRLARAQADIANGRIDPREFDERNAGLSPQELLERLLCTAPTVSEDIVVVHGDATFTNILVDASGRIGFVDCGHCGKADRYVDLALVSAEIEDRFGAQYVGSFFTAYGVGFPSRDTLKMRFFSDLYELF
jgi:aminoglycoside 3'-phosphotransferase-2